MNKPIQKPITDDREKGEIANRRKALQTMTTFAGYAAPFTVLALTRKTDAASHKYAKPR